MSRRTAQQRTLLSATFAGVILFGAASLAGAEVIIERSLPETGTNKSEAEWKPPGIAREAPADAARGEQVQQLSGRLIIGGYGSGGGVGGYAVEDWSTDSKLQYSRLIGADGLLDVDAEAFRKDRIDSFEQRYGGSLGFAGEALRLGVSGLYDQHSAVAYEGRSEETSSKLALDLATSRESLLPVEFSYSSQWDEMSGSDEAEEVQERLEEQHSADLAAELALGSAALEADGYFDLEHDRIDMISTLGYGGTLGFTLPLTEAVSLYLATSPGYSSSEQQELDEITDEIALESDAGVLIKVEELLDGEVHGSRVDAWRRDPEIEGGDQIHSSIWKGRTSWSLTAPEQLTSSAAYRVSGKGGSVLGHDISAESVWSTEDVLLRKAKLDGRYVINEATDFTERRRRQEWGSLLELSPAERMMLTASYDGSRKEDETVSWSHNAAGSYSHTPLEEFGYGLGSSYGYTHTLGESDAVYRYSGSGNLDLRPQIGFARWDIGLAELLELEAASGGEDLLSKSTASLALPVLRQVSLRYLFTWEWTELTAADAADGSAFSHATGMTVAGKGLPFRLKASYLLGHGYRGMQHHADAGLDVSVAESFDLIAEFNYRYAETVEYETPFRFTMLLHYEF